jgi:hypothetical protein
MIIRIPGHTFISPFNTHTKAMLLLESKRGPEQINWFLRGWRAGSLTRTDLFAMHKIAAELYAPGWCEHEQKLAATLREVIA